jgi:carbamoyltransferase
MDWAHCVQRVTEEIVVNAAQGLHDRTGHTRLAVAGGVALNCVANARILEKTPFKEFYAMPNAGDCGLAVGSALYGYHEVLGISRREAPATDYLGRVYADDEIRVALDASGVAYEKCDDVERVAAALIAKGAIIGWFQGGSEHGPRALGHRSILADPRTPASKARLDAEIKRREWFRPYAPSVLADRADEYFETMGPSPYMLQAVQARPLARERAPGIVHVDNSARMQTVTMEQEPRYYRLISRFAELTGVPIVLNTSFNGYGEPVVERPEDALAAFRAMGLDALVLGDYLVRRAD